MRALAAVFAHPDDETFATGGTLAKYADEGARISLYCATDGDAGRTSGIPVASREELGRIRRAELLDACARLGIRSVDHGGHADGALNSADPDVVLGQIVAFLRRERPQVVLTFGPEGAPTGGEPKRLSQ
jgi:LmbE family N-acetylglucosaminyl deacetylase